MENSNTQKLALTQVTDFATKAGLNAKGGEIFALSGDLGSGKTTFAKAFGRALGIKQNIPSPTFVIMQEFPTPKTAVNGRKITLYHLDLYRTKSFKEIEALGITEWWGHPETITIIEWAEKIDRQLPKEAIRLNLYRDV